MVLGEVLGQEAENEVAMFLKQIVLQLLNAVGRSTFAIRGGAAATRDSSRAAHGEVR